MAWAAVALSFQGLKALGVPEESLASFPPEFQQGMAARAAELGDTGESAPEHWEQPLGRPDVHLGDLRAGPGPRAPGGGARRCPRRPAGGAGRRTDLAAGHLHAADRTDLVRVQGRHQQPGHRGQRHPRHQPARGTVQGRRIRPRLPERERRPAPDARARGARPQRQLRRLPQAPDPRGGVPPVRPCPRQESSRGGAARRQVRRPLAERRAAGARPGARRPGARGRSGAEQRLPLRRERRRSRPQVPARRPRPSDEPTRLEDHRRSADAPDHPAELQLRPDAARGRPRGRRGRSRHPVLLPPGEAGPRVRVRQDAVDQRGHLLSARPPRWTRWSGRTTGPAGSPSPSSRSADASRSCPSSWSTAAASTCFMPGLRALRWLAELDT